MNQVEDKIIQTVKNTFPEIQLVTKEGVVRYTKIRCILISRKGSGQCSSETTVGREKI